MRHYLVLIVIAVIFVVCGGNSILIMYEGERKASSEVAIIEIDNVLVVGIDSLQRKYQAFTEKYIEVLPGKHEISVHYSSWKGRSNRPIHLVFSAEKGHKYIVKARGGYNLWTAWILDIAADSIVAGHKETNDKDNRGILN